MRIFASFARRVISWNCLEIIAKQKTNDDEIAVHLVTTQAELEGEQQVEYFEKRQTTCATIGIRFARRFDETSTLHARHIVTGHGWKILLDRSLAMFQRFDMNDTFDFANRLQRYHPWKVCEVTFLKIDR